MLADPRFSRLVLINPSRGEFGEVSPELAARRRESLLLLPAVREVFGVPVHAAGDHDAGKIPPAIADCFDLQDIDVLSLWHDQRFNSSLAASNIGAVFLGGAWLEEEVLVAAVEGVRLGYDVRVLVDISLARFEPDRSLVLHRLGLHGVLPTTMRQILLEWAVCVDDPALKQRVQQILG